MAEGVREGRRTTPQLAVVLEAVRSSGAEHPTAERIYERVRRVLPSISLGTVYRNLQRLVHEGKIGAAQLGARSLQYDPTATPHDHFVCRSCGRVEDLVAGAPEPLRDSARRVGHDVMSHTLVLYGQCRDCRDAG
jgi:Fur family peroxide stress response transcriptional regulator